jgi:RNA polymerase sigma-70 factor (ECF subfamily)
MPPERQLDPAALGDHIDRLYRAAWGLCGSREEAEDLVQETFARVLRKPRILRSEDDLGYLLRVLRNTFRDALIAIDVIGLSYREAAQALRVREATITTRLHRARQRVARTLVPENAPENS